MIPYKAKKTAVVIVGIVLLALCVLLALAGLMLPSLALYAPLLVSSGTMGFWFSILIIAAGLAIDAMREQTARLDRRLSDIEEIVKRGSAS